MSTCRQRYDKENEAGVNKHINLELYSMYVYTSMASQFDRDDVDLKGFVDYFWKSASDKMDRASTLMTYQNLRGGRINLKDIKKPDRDEWGSAAEAMEAALDLEKTVNQGLLDLDRTAEEHLDPEMSHFIKRELLTDQVERMKIISGYVTNLQRVGPGHGEYHFDHETLGE
eukprot:Em0001g2418a